MDFPTARFHKPVISSLSVEAAGWPLANTSASSAWPSANRAIYVPFALAAPYPVTKLWWMNGATVSGNVDCGIYAANGARLLSTGSTAQAVVSVIQSVSVTPFLLLPGSYYMALAVSNTTARFASYVAGVTADLLKLLGFAQQATAFPLPAAFTLATVASAFVPVFGIGHPTVI